MNGNRTADVTVVGAGGAGLFTALTAAQAGANVVLVSATPLAQAASYWAQGGVAAALAADDSPAQHLADTVAAGRNLSRVAAAEVLCSDAADAISQLEQLGVTFDADRYGNLALALEGGHSAHRVVHAGGSATGRRILRTLSAAAAEEPKIEVLEGARAVALLKRDGRCSGVALHDGTVIESRAVVLSTGGAAALWSHTTNPPGAVGVGLQLAHAAGAKLADLEFVQFHPTAVSGVPGRNGFLISEAVRGEGATLLNDQGERFVDELAPRDVVALAVWDLITAGTKQVWLDMREIDPARFPNVTAALNESGIDTTKQLIPVAPAAHYTMGGVATDLKGRSSLPGLYAVGECSCTGLHGANRLASNSLTECFVFGRRAGLAALDEGPRGTSESESPAYEPSKPDPALQRKLWQHAGLIRDSDGLQQLLNEAHPLVRLTAMCALKREESRGAHRRSDFAKTASELDDVHTFVEGDKEPTLEQWA